MQTTTCKICARLKGPVHGLTLFQKAPKGKDFRRSRGEGVWSLSYTRRSPVASSPERQMFCTGLPLAPSFDA